jgi:hypothetical protein
MSEMFTSFINWLDSHISREEPSSVIKSLIGLMAFAGLLGTIFGNQAIRVGAFLLVIMFVLSVILALLADRRRLTRANDRQRAQITRYCSHLVESNPDPQLSIDCWRQWVFVRPNGDVREVMNLKAVVLSERIYFVRLTSSSRWNQPQKHLHDVKVTMRTIAADSAPGPRWHVTTSWQAGKLTYIGHLHEAANRGEEISFEMVREWPAKCHPLMRNEEAESFILRTTNRLQIRSAEYRVILPPGYEAVSELIGARNPDAQLSADTETDKENRKVYVWRSGPIPTMSWIGMRLQLK